VSLFNVFSANIRKVAIEMIRYLPNTISLLVSYYAIFLAMFFGLKTIGDPATMEANIRFLIVGNAFWFLLILGISSMGFEISSEATRGTLEQLYMSPEGSWRILLARMIGTLLINVAIMTLMVMLSMVTAGQWLRVDLASLVLILLPTLIGMMGLGYLVAGLTLVYKQVQALLQILQFVFVGMAFVPLSRAPFLELAPVVKGIDLTRQLMVQGRPLADITVMDWTSLIASAGFYFTFGLIFFRFCERRAMARGLLAHY